MRVWRKLWVLSVVGIALMALVPESLAAENQSPFTTRLDVVDVTPNSVFLRLMVEVPPRHLVYAQSVSVNDAAGNALRQVRGVKPAVKDDPYNPGERVEVFNALFDSVWCWEMDQPVGTVTVTLQGCDSEVCFMPEEHRFRFERSSGTLTLEQGTDADALSSGDEWTAGFSFYSGGGYMSASDFIAFLDQHQAVDKADKPSSGLRGFLRDPQMFMQKHGLLLTLLLVLVGGALLNLTPCILPMIPINLAIIGASAGTRGRGFLLGSGYGSGIVLVYGGLGWLILRSGLFFGALQSSPWFSLAVGIIFAVLALAMFDLLLIDLSKFGTTSGSQNKGMLAAFSAGALSALLAGACVAPVVLAVLLLAGNLYAQGVSGAQFLPFVLGLGMALPWPLAGAGLAVTPVPGAWMERVKQAFGVMLALLAIYYFYLAIIGFIAPASKREGVIQAGDKTAWHAVLKQAQEENKPIFVDFWATWCKNCSAMERTTFADQQVLEKLDDYIVVKVQAERPREPATKTMLDAFGIRGLPGFVILHE